MVTALVNNPGATWGQALDLEGAYFFRGNKAAGFAVLRGQILVKDPSTAPDSYKIPTPGAAIPGPFYIATEPAASGDLKVSLAKGGIWTLKSEGVIEVDSDVMLSTTSAQHVVLSTAVTTVALLQARVGVCKSFIDTWRSGTPTASVQDDLIAVDLNQGY